MTATEAAEVIETLSAQRPLATIGMLLIKGECLLVELTKTGLMPINTQGMTQQEYED